MTTGRRTKPELAPADAASWAALAQTVTPLKPRRTPRGVADADVAPPAPATRTPTPAPRPRGREPAPPAPRPADPPPPATFTHGDAPGVDRRAFQRAKRNPVSAAAELDLHGRTQAEAHGALVRFIEGARAASRASVRVITGKGARGDRARGVLQDAVPRWLNEQGLREFVRGFDYARPEAGGTGALIVLLRRPKPRAAPPAGKDTIPRKDPPCPKGAPSQKGSRP